jgi:hypothetical protein
MLHVNQKVNGTAAGAERIVRRIIIIIPINRLMLFSTRSADSPDTLLLVLLGCYSHKD